MSGLQSDRDWRWLSAPPPLLQALLVGAIGAAVLGAGCGSSESPTDTSSDAGAGPAADRPTFSRDVAPVIFRHCGACHQPRGVAPFPLDSYDAVRKRGRQIVSVLESGFMPPWPPAPGYGDFRDARRLPAGDVELIAHWLESGAAEGNPELLPPLPQLSDGWRLGEPDLVVELREQFVMPADGVDIVRNFVVPLELDTIRYVLAVDFDPGTPALVHHAAVLSDTTGTSRGLDSLDPEPGYAGMVGAVAPGGHFFGWTPGRVPSALADGMAWEAVPGTDLVLQLHLQPTGKPEPLRPRVGLYFTDEPPRRFPTSLPMAVTTLDIPAGDNAYTERDEWLVPVDVDALAVYPHQHYLGRQIKLRATRPDGSEEWLLWIGNWDFNWQDEYRYREPVFLPAGTKLDAEFVFDNSADNERNPHQPPIRVLWGGRSTDEMANIWIQVLPRDPEQIDVLNEAIYRKDLADATAGYTMRHAADPGDAAIASQVGMLLLKQFALEDALLHLDRALDLGADYWPVHHNRGLALAGLGRHREAAAAYQRALELNPSSAGSERGLGAVYTLTGEPDAAIRHYLRALEIRPDLDEAHTNLAVLLARLGRHDEALFHYQDALRLRPDSAEAHGNLAVLLTELGRFEDAESHYLDALALRPDYATTHKNLANLRARQGRTEEALESLRRALDLEPGDLEALYFLALGQAQLGRYDDAAATLRRLAAIDPEYLDVAELLQQLE